MTPNEIYALPTTREQDWRDLGHEAVQMVFGVSGFAYNDFDHEYPPECAKILIADKLYFHEDSERGTSVRSISFDGKPFALLMTAGEDGSEHEDVMITDEEIFRAAKRHVLDHLVEHILAKDHGHDVRDPAKFELKGYYNAMFVRVGDEVRFVDPGQCRRTDGILVYDEVALEAKFSELIRPHIDVVRTRGLVDEELRLKAIEVLKASVPKGMKIVNIDQRTASGGWIAFAYTDGVDTLAMVFDKREFSTFYWRDTGPTRVGPASVLSAIERRVAGVPVDADGLAARELSETFGCTSLEAVQALENWNICDNLCEEILRVVGFPSPVDSQEGPLDGYRVYAFVAEHPEAVAYCQDRVPTAKQAREIMTSLNSRLEREVVKAARVSGADVV
jgi:hypothetical protein